MLSVTAQNVRLAQLDRAFGYGPKGREFESSNAHTKRCKHCLQRFFALYESLPAILPWGNAMFFFEYSTKILKRGKTALLCTFF